MTALRDGVTIAAADPDRDRVWFTRLDTHETTSVALQRGDEPGRVVEDDDGRVHVALRRGGAVLSIAADHSTVLSRRAVCVAPRGLAWDARGAELLVACAGGELVSISREGAVRSTLTAHSDLRDALVWRDRRFVTTFRRAEIIEVDRDGRTLSIGRPARGNTLRNEYEPAVAWRTIVHPDEGIVMLHQTAAVGDIGNIEAAAAPGGWGPANRSCTSGTVLTALTIFDGTTQATPTTQVATAGLTVDVAPHRGGVVIATPGRAADQVHVLFVAISAAQRSLSLCAAPTTAQVIRSDAQATSVVSDGARIVAQLRDPGAITISDADEAFVRFPDARAVTDTGHAIFHTNTQRGIACASCHPEGGEDGHVWDFRGVGPRRTQSMRGGIARTAPFHWDGDRRDLSHVMDLTFTAGMGGDALDARRKLAFASWLDALPTLRTHAPAPGDEVLRGRELFDGAAGCAGCHAGSAFTSNESMDIGTGGAFQVPSLLGVMSRAPFLHDGRAADLSALLGSDAMSPHRASPDERRALVAFLSTL